MKCAKQNAQINNVASNISFIQGDLFTPFRTEKEFDLVLFNAPYLPYDEEDHERTWIERAWAGGVSGREVIDRFLRETPKHLRPKGEILLMQSTLSDVEKTLQLLKEEGLRANIASSQDIPFFESIVLIKGTYTANEPNM